VAWLCRHCGSRSAGLSSRSAGRNGGWENADNPCQKKTLVSGTCRLTRKDLNFLQSWTRREKDRVCQRQIPQEAMYLDRTHPTFEKPVPLSQMMGARRDMFCFRCSAHLNSKFDNHIAAAVCLGLLTQAIGPYMAYAITITVMGIEWVSTTVVTMV
jgi:hypothetical protein